MKLAKLKQVIEAEKQKEVTIQSLPRQPHPMGMAVYGPVAGLVRESRNCSAWVQGDCRSNRNLIHEYCKDCKTYFSSKVLDGEIVLPFESAEEEEEFAEDEYDTDLEYGLHLLEENLTLIRGLIRRGRFAVLQLEDMRTLTKAARKIDVFLKDFEDDIESMNEGQMTQIVKGLERK